MFGDYERLAIALEFPTLTEYEIARMVAPQGTAGGPPPPVRRPTPQPRRPAFDRRRTRPGPPPVAPRGPTPSNN